MSLSSISPMNSGYPNCHASQILNCVFLFDATIFSCPDNWISSLTISKALLIRDTKDSCSSFAKVVTTSTVAERIGPSSRKVV